jgi:hypothetical protein
MQIICAAEREIKPSAHLKGGAAYGKDPSRAAEAVQAIARVLAAGNAKQAACTAPGRPK